MMLTSYTVYVVGDQPVSVISGLVPPVNFQFSVISVSAGVALVSRIVSMRRLSSLIHHSIITACNFDLNPYDPTWM